MMTFITTIGLIVAGGFYGEENKWGDQLMFPWRDERAMKGAFLKATPAEKKQIIGFIRANGPRHRVGWMICQVVNRDTGKKTTTISCYALGQEGEKGQPKGLTIERICAVVGVETPKPLHSKLDQKRKAGRLPQPKRR